MPTLERILTPDDLATSGTSSAFDLAPYVEILEQAQDQGAGGFLALSEDEKPRGVKTRLTRAAKLLDSKPLLRWLKPRDTDDPDRVVGFAFRTEPVRRRRTKAEREADAAGAAEARTGKAAKDAVPA